MGIPTTWIDRGRRWPWAVAAIAFACAPTAAQNAPRLGETPAGDILADAARLVASTEIALVPGNALRDDGDARSVAPAMLLASLATAGDSVVVMDLTGRQLLAALERSVAYAGKPFAGFLQVSGLKIAFDPKAAIGARIKSALVGEAALDAARTYKVAMPRPLADGQLGYFQIWNKDQIARDTGKTLEDALRAIAASRPGPTGIQGRIVVAPPSGAR